MKAKAKLILFVGMAVAAAMFMGGLSISGLLPTQTVSSQSEPGVAPDEAAPAAYSPGVWANQVASCPVDESSLDKYTVDSTSLGLKPLKSGAVTARCAVENLPVATGEIQMLEVSYRDGDGVGRWGCQVTAKLTKIDMLNPPGAEAIATFNSNSFAGTGWQNQYVVYAHDFDFDHYAYYVEVTVKRVNPQIDCRANIVRLTWAVG